MLAKAKSPEASPPEGSMCDFFFSFDSSHLHNDQLRLAALRNKENTISKAGRWNITLQGLF